MPKHAYVDLLVAFFDAVLVAGLFVVLVVLWAKSSQGEDIAVEWCTYSVGVSLLLRGEFQLDFTPRC